MRSIKIWIGLLMILVLLMLMGHLHAVYVTYGTIDEVMWRYVKDTGENNALKVEKEFENAYDDLSILAESFKYIQGTGQIDRESLNSLLRDTLQKKEHYLSIWTAWEPNILDDDEPHKNTYGHDETGRYIPYLFKAEGEIHLSPLIYGGSEQWYMMPKEMGENHITKPYYSMIDDDEILMTTLSIPVIIDDQIVAVLGLDIKLDSLESLIQNMVIFDSGYCSLIASDGSFVVHLMDEIISKPINDYIEIPDIVNRISEGQTVYYTQESENKNDIIYMFTPVKIHDSSSFWSLLTVVPRDDIHKNSSWFYSVLMVAIVVILIVGYFKVLPKVFRNDALDKREEI